MGKVTFGTKSEKWKGTLEVTVDLPTSLDDVDLINRRYGSAERMIAQANRTWVIQAQTGMRKRTADEAMEYALNFCDNGKKDTYVPKVSKAEAKEKGFSAEQLAWLKAKGLKVE